MRAHETLLEPLQSIPQAPCTGLEPVFSARQAGRHTRCVTGQSNRKPHQEPTKGRSEMALARGASAVPPQHPQRCWWDSNPHVLSDTIFPGCIPTRAVGSRCVSFRDPGGTRTHVTRFCRSPPRLSTTGSMQKPAAGIEPARAPLQEGCSACRAALAHECDRRESNPHNPGSQPGLAAALSSATVLQPGIEPGTRPSQGRVMSLSPSKQEQYPDQESNLGLDLRRVA